MRGFVPRVLDILVLVSTLLFTGCTQIVTRQLSGVVQLARVSDAMIRVYGLLEDGSKGTLLAETTTNSEGEYTVSLGSYSDHVFVESIGGTYLDEATGETKSASTLSAIVLSNEASHAAISPMSTLVKERIVALVQGASIEAAKTVSTNEVASLFGVLPEDLAVVPTSPTALVATDAKAARAAMGIAAFSYFLKDFLYNGSAVSVSDALVALTDELKDDGKLNGSASSPLAKSIAIQWKSSMTAARRLVATNSSLFFSRVSSEISDTIASTAIETGSNLEGPHDGSFYINGVSTNLENGTGLFIDKYYYSGHLAQIADGQMDDGFFYKDGQRATGTVDSVVYNQGKRLTGMGNGVIGDRETLYVLGREIAFPVSVYVVGGGLKFLKNGDYYTFESIGYDRGIVFSKWTGGAVNTYFKVATLRQAPLTYTFSAQPAIDTYIADHGSDFTNSYVSIEMAMVDANNRLIGYTNGNTLGNASPVKSITNKTLTLSAGEFPSLAGVTVPSGLWMFSGAGGAPTVRAPFYKSNNPHQLFEPFDVVTLLSDNAQFALVGDEGNSGDVLESYEPLNPSSSRLSGFGAVSYQFGIGKNLVTLEDYAEFLNSVALEEDSNQLYRSEMDTDHQTSGIHRSDSAGSFRYQVKSGKSKRPVTYVSWLSAARYVNWLHNGRPVGRAGAQTTESGVYNLSSNGDYQDYGRSEGARYFLPNENEWYKSAYYKGGSKNAGYYLFATQSNSEPMPTQDDNRTNQANFNSVANGTTDVGLYSKSPSAYGTFDQTGNVWQWLENEGPVTQQKARRGGSWANTSSTPSRLSAEVRSASPITSATQHVGFRVAKTRTLFPP